MFAYSFTLLAIELQAPGHLGAQALSRALLGQWPEFLAFGLSFLFSANLRRCNHFQLSRWERTTEALDRPVFLLLPGVTFLRYSTAFLAGNGINRKSAGFYSAVLAHLYGVQSLVYLTASRVGLFGGGVATRNFFRTAMDSIAPRVLFLIALLSSFVGLPSVSLACWCVVLPARRVIGLTSTK